MKQILIATHGKMASGILYTAEMVLGKQENVTVIPKVGLSRIFRRSRLLTSFL